MIDYKTDIINIVQNCNNSYWIKVVYAYVKKIIEMIP